MTQFLDRERDVTEAREEFRALSSEAQDMELLLAVKHASALKEMTGKTTVADSGAPA